MKIPQEIQPRLHVVDRKRSHCAHILRHPGATPGAMFSGESRMARKFISKAEEPFCPWNKLAQALLAGHRHKIVYTLGSPSTSTRSRAWPLCLNSGVESYLEKTCVHRTLVSIENGTLEFWALSVNRRSSRGKAQWSDLIAQTATHSRALSKYTKKSFIYTASLI